MTKLLLALALLITPFLSGVMPAFQPPEVNSPRPGDVLRGVVEVQGTVPGENLGSYDVSFGYADDVSDSWFIISTGQAEVTNGVLAEWDTTAIADDIYRLRVQVFYQEGDPEVIIVENLRVRNYTPVETRTAEPGKPIEVNPVSTNTTAPEKPAATPLARNPMEIKQEEFTKSILSGAGISAAVLLILGFRALIRKHRRGGRL
jgi:hypothetical protein